MDARTPSLPRRLTLLVGVLAALVALSACQPPYEGPAGAPRVAVVGDSITEWGTPEISAALGDYQRTVKGIAGIDLARGRTELVQPAAATTPDVMVIELGINSALDGWTGSDLVSLERTIADVADVPCVVWVSLDVISAPYFDAQGPGTLSDRIAQMRTSITKRLPSHPNMHLADWGKVQMQQPGYYASNGLHLSDSGMHAFGTWVAQQVDTYC